MAIRTALSNARKGEIAVKMVKHRLHKDGIHLTKNFKQEVAKSAEDIGVPASELASFIEELVREMVEDTFR